MGAVAESCALALLPSNPHWAENIGRARWPRVASLVSILRVQRSLVIRSAQFSQQHTANSPFTSHDSTSAVPCLPAAQAVWLVAVAHTATSRPWCTPTTSAPASPPHTHAYPDSPTPVAAAAARDRGQAVKVVSAAASTVGLGALHCDPVAVDVQPVQAADALQQQAHSSSVTHPARLGSCAPSCHRLHPKGPRTSSTSSSLAMATNA